MYSRLVSDYLCSQRCLHALASCFHSVSAGRTGTQHHDWFISVPGHHACWVHTLPTELHPQSWWTLLNSWNKDEVNGAIAMHCWWDTLKVTLSERRQTQKATRCGCHLWDVLETVNYRLRKKTSNGFKGERSDWLRRHTRGLWVFLHVCVCVFEHSWGAERILVELALSFQFNVASRSETQVTRLSQCYALSHFTVCDRPFVVLEFHSYVSYVVYADPNYALELNCMKIIYQ